MVMVDIVEWDVREFVLLSGCLIVGVKKAEMDINFFFGW